MNRVYRQAASGSNGKDYIPAAGWCGDHWYTKYSPLLYGIILQLTCNKIRAGRILKEIIFDLSGRHNLGFIDHLALCKMVFQHSYQYTLNYLRYRGIEINLKYPLGDAFPLLHLFYFEAKTVDEVAARLNKDKQEVFRELRHEFKLLQDFKLVGAA